MPNLHKDLTLTGITFEAICIAIDQTCSSVIPLFLVLGQWRWSPNIK